MRRQLQALFVATVSLGAFFVNAEEFASDGVKISYDVSGDGVAVVLIHGLTGSKNDFSSLADNLSDAGFRSIVLDLRGHGLSAKPHDPAKYGKQIVTDIRNLLDHLSVVSAHIVGYSMGGDVANKLRETYPERVRSCVIGGAGLGVSEGWADKPHDFEAIADALANGNGFVPLLRLPGAITPGIAPEKKIAAINELMIGGEDTHALSAFLRAYEELEIDATKLQGNEVPTLIVVGSNDAEHASAVKLSRSMGNCRLHVIDDANHFEARTHRSFSPTVKSFIVSVEKTK